VRLVLEDRVGVRLETGQLDLVLVAEPAFAARRRHGVEHVAEAEVVVGSPRAGHARWIGQRVGRRREQDRHHSDHVRPPEHHRGGV